MFTNSKGNSVMYVEIKNALYGIMQEALLFYEKLSTDLTNYGFSINDYDPCVANKFVDGKQLTVVWHVDDLKISHVNPLVVTDLVNWLKREI